MYGVWINSKRLLNLDRQPVFTFGSAGNDGWEPVLILTPNFTWAEPNA